MSRKGAKTAQSELGLDAALEKLEKLVEEMERGDLPLEEAMAKYSEGAELSRLCLTQLQSAEQAVDKVLREADGKLSEFDLVVPEAD